MSLETILFRNKSSILAGGLFVLSLGFGDNMYNLVDKNTSSQNYDNVSSRIYPNCTSLANFPSFRIRYCINDEGNVVPYAIT